jgi:integrase
MTMGTCERAVAGPWEGHRHLIQAPDGRRRHGFITALLDRGVRAHVARELAGHADLTTTERYTNAAAKNKHAAIAVLARIGEAA